MNNDPAGESWSHPQSTCMPIENYIVSVCVCVPHCRHVNDAFSNGGARVDIVRSHSPT